LEFDLLAARAHASLWAGLASAGADVGAHDRIVAARAGALRPPTRAISNGSLGSMSSKYAWSVEPSAKVRLFRTLRTDGCPWERGTSLSSAATRGQFISPVVMRGRPPSTSATRRRGY
jgi:hypothetical protein